MSGITKKPPVCVPTGTARRLLDSLSKAMLMDIAWNLALLGTDEQAAQVLTHVAREAVIVADLRQDRIDPEFKRIAAMRIDADPEVI